MAAWATKSQSFFALLDLVKEAHTDEVDALVKDNMRLRRRVARLQEGAEETGSQCADDDDEERRYYSEGALILSSPTSKKSMGGMTGAESWSTDNVRTTSTSAKKLKHGANSNDLLESILQGNKRGGGGGGYMDVTASTAPGKARKQSGNARMPGVPKALFGSRDKKGATEGGSASSSANVVPSVGYVSGDGDKSPTSRANGAKARFGDGADEPMVEVKTMTMQSSPSDARPPGSLMDRFRTVSGLSPRSTPTSARRHTKALPFEKKPSMSELAAESPNWHPPLHAAYRIASHKYFEPAFAMLILVNSFTIAGEAQFKGWQVGFDMGYPDTHAPDASVDTVFEVINWMFGVLFAIELLIKIFGYGRKFFLECWNYFDALLVIFWSLEVYLVYFVGDAGTALIPVDPSFLRIIRLMKLMRLVRLVRKIQGFDALYLMTTALSGSATILAWSAALLVVLLMMLALFANQILTDYYINVDDPESRNITPEARMAVYEYFGTFSRSLLSLFEMTLANWPPVCRLLVENVSEAYLIPALIHKLTIGFAVVGVINGVFMQETFKVAATDDRIMVRQKQMAMKTHEHKMRNLFEKADTTGDGCLDFEEFKEVISNEGVSTWLASMELDASDVRTLFLLIDESGDGSITVDELMVGVSKLKGHARSIDLAVSMREQREAAEKFADVSLALADVSANLTDLRSALKELGKAQDKIDKHTMATAMATAQTAQWQRRTLSAVHMEELSPMHAKSRSGFMDHRASMHSTVPHSEHGFQIPDAEFQTIDLDAPRSKAASPHDADSNTDGHSRHSQERPYLPFLDDSVLHEAVLEASAHEDVEDSSDKPPKVLRSNGVSKHNGLLPSANKPAAFVI